MPSSSSMPSLPAGFRFHPTDEELIVHYLMNQAASTPCPVPIVAEVNIYQCNPWDLPARALFGEKEWYFFSPRDRKYPNGARPNRAAGEGYWKATGTDKAILSTPASSNIGVKKALVFYSGRPPKGTKTDWIMHEYRLTGAADKNANRRRGSSMRLDDWVLCRIHKKSNDFHQLSDQEQEGSTVEEESLTSPKPESAGHVQSHQTTAMGAMSKSCSLTDLLSTIDYSTLSQLLLDGPIEVEPPLIYPETQTNQALNSHIDSPQAGMYSDYVANSCNGLKRKRIMTTDAAGSLGDGSSSFSRNLKLPNDCHYYFGGTSSSSSYCNQQQAVGTSGLQCSSLLNNPFRS